MIAECDVQNAELSADAFCTPQSAVQFTRKTTTNAETANGRTVLFAVFCIRGCLRLNHRRINGKNTGCPVVKVNSALVVTLP